MLSNTLHAQWLLLKENPVLYLVLIQDALEIASQMAVVCLDFTMCFSKVDLLVVSSRGIKIIFHFICNVSLLTYRKADHFISQ